VITPYQYALQYWNLTVRLDSGAAVVNVHDYQNPGPKHVVKAVPYKVWGDVQTKFSEHVKREGMSIYGHPIPTKPNWPLSIQLVHKGGGSVREIQTVLALVHRYWKELRGSCMSSSPDLQAYVDLYIGLYCSGFVGAYLSEILGYAGKAPGVNKDILEKFAPVCWRHSCLDETYPRDVLVWTDGSHVAIIDHIWPGEGDRKARVLESSLDGGYRGLEISDYRLHASGQKSNAQDVFSVTRGLPCARPRVEAYIVSPWA
jgi:hypothetical protein